MSAYQATQKTLGNASTSSTQGTYLWFDEAELPIFFNSIIVYFLEMIWDKVIVWIKGFVDLQWFFRKYTANSNNKVRIFPLNMRDIIIYVARWWEKYLPKRSLRKNTCSWRDKLIVLWTTEQTSKNIFTFIKNVNMEKVYVI